jgi:hypothetical protein
MIAMTNEQIEAAHAETERLCRELDIVNADHVALWLEANMPGASLAWLACRIVDAHEAALSTQQAAGEAVAGTPFDLMQEFYLSRYYDPQAKRPADNVQAAIQFVLDRRDKPVAYTGSGSMMALKDGREGFIWPTSADAHPIPLYAAPQPQPPAEVQQPVAWMYVSKGGETIFTKIDMSESRCAVPLYATPQPVAKSSCDVEALAEILHRAEVSEVPGPCDPPISSVHFPKRERDRYMRMARAIATLATPQQGVAGDVTQALKSIQTRAALARMYDPGEEVDNILVSIQQAAAAALATPAEVQQGVALDDIAKVIDPDAWHETLPTDACGAYWTSRRIAARVKAEAILALFATPQQGQEVEALREALGYVRSELALFAACCAVSNKVNDTFVGTETKAKEWVAYINDALAQSPSKARTARDLFEIARPCFHYAPRGTPDGGAFERSETGRLLMAAMEKIAAAGESPHAAPLTDGGKA